MEKGTRINLSKEEEDLGLALGVVSSFWVSEPPPDERPPTLAALLSPGKRPPPEPPPPPRCTALRGTCCKPRFRCIGPLLPKTALTDQPPAALIPVRPPPKPIWPDSVSKFGDVTLFVLFKILFCVCVMFVVMPGAVLFSVCDVLLCLFQTLVLVRVESVVAQEILAFWNKVCSGFIVIIINLIILFNQLVSPVFVFKLDHPETTNSRYEPATAKDMIRNWIDLKTVDTLLSLAFNLVWKKFVWVLGLYVWLDFGLLFPVHYRCNAANFLIGWIYFLLAKLKSVWWEDVDCVVFLLADPKSGIYITFQWMSDLWFKMNDTKATYGRIEPALVKQTIRNWIDIKTVAPLVMNQAGMKWTCWLLVYEIWIDVDLYSTFSMYSHRIGLDQLLELFVLSGLGMPIHSLLNMVVTFWFFFE